jgi:hypothetical protein
MSVKLNQYDGHPGTEDSRFEAIASLAYKIFELLPSTKEIEQLGVFLVLNQGQTPEQAGAAVASLEDSIGKARSVLSEAMAPPPRFDRNEG